jgi:hypothetical protein
VKVLFIVDVHVEWCVEWFTSICERQAGVFGLPNNVLGSCVNLNDN